jgi:hypothetical protein
VKTKSYIHYTAKQSLVNVSCFCRVGTNTTPLWASVLAKPVFETFVAPYT